MKRKNLLKKISLGAVGGASIGAIAFGVSKIVQFCKNDSKTLSLDYSVGALTDEGKYQEDECKLYTKKAFACEGLRVTFDFDAEVNGQFYFYDINDKYLSKSDVITEGSSVSVPLNGAYARAVVIPTNDEDSSISFTEKYKYGSQMQVKVDKNAESNINNKFRNLNGNVFQLVDTIGELSFKRFCLWNAEESKFYKPQYADDFVTINSALNLSNYKNQKINIDYTKVDSSVLFSSNYANKCVMFFYNNDNKLILTKNSDCSNKDSCTIDIPSNASYLIFNVYLSISSLTESELKTKVFDKMPSFIRISK